MNAAEDLPGVPMDLLVFLFVDPRANMDPVSLPTNATVIMDTEAETVQCRVPLADGAPPVDTRVPVTMGPRVTQ